MEFAIAMTHPHRGHVERTSDGAPPDTSAASSRRISSWRRVSRGRGRWAAAVALGALLLLLGVAAVDATRRASDARAQLLAVRADLDQASATLAPVINFDASEWPSADAFRDARTRIADARLQVAAARDRLGWTENAAGWLGWAPRWGDELAGAPRVLSLAEEMLASADRLLTASAPLFDTQGGIVDAAHEVLVVRRPLIESELATLDRLRLEAEKLRGITWNWPFEPVSDALDTVSRDLVRVPEGREVVATVGAGFGALFGYGQPSEVLLLGQNDHEIRPTGGFIGTMGMLRLEAGSVIGSDYRSSYDFSPPNGTLGRDAPPAFAQFFGAGEWHIRDANWWPDFATSAQAVLNLLAEDAGLTPQHVLAVDTTMTGLLLGVFGPVAVDGYPEPLTPENWFIAVEAQLTAAEPGLGRSAARSSYLQPVLEELLKRAEATSAQQLPALVRALQAGVAGRHLQLYSTLPEVQAIAAKFGAQGAMLRPDGEDFVAVVDANLSYAKIQPAISRDVTYQVRPDGAVQLLVTWANDLPTFTGDRYARLGADGLIWDQRTRTHIPAPGYFATFTRIYLPPGAELLEPAAGFDQPPRLEFEAGMTVASGFVDVGPGPLAEVGDLVDDVSTAHRRPAARRDLQEAGWRRARTDPRAAGHRRWCDPAVPGTTLHGCARGADTTPRRR